MESDERASAESIYGEFLRRRERGEEVDFDGLCREHPGLANALEALHSLSEKDREATPLYERTGEGPEDSRAPTGDAPSEEGLPAARRGVEPSLGFRSGDRIGSYKLLSVVGEGGFGVVYRAEQEQPVRRTVALKIIKLGMDTEEVVARFEAERQALALMNHPNIAKVFDGGATDNGRPYFVMEYVAGIPVTDYCDRHRLGNRERLELFIAVCEAVQHAHQKAVIHRDIKPSNVLVKVQDGKAVPVIIDFGIAKATGRRLTEKTLFTEMGQLIGTPAYMSPEQAEATVLDVDTRTDVYSLGVLLYELLVGALPFDLTPMRLAGYAEIQRIIRDKEPLKPSTRLGRLGEDSRKSAEKRHTDLRTLLRQLRGDLDWITMKAMAKERTHRYGTASELAADIRRHLNHEPVVAGPPGFSYRFAKFVRKRRVPLSVALGVIILGLAIAAVVQHLSYAEIREKAIEACRLVHDDGRARLETLRALMARLGGLKRQHAETTDRLESWQPIWERQDEVKLYKEISTLENDVRRLYGETFHSLTRAHGMAPSDWEGREGILASLRELLHERLPETSADTMLDQVLQGVGESPVVEAFGVGRVSLASEPSGADVYCFRYENAEERRVPLPFDCRAGRSDPGRGLLRKPFLEVERIWVSDRSPFEAGDRLIAVDGKAAALRMEFVRALSGLGPDEKVEVTVRRSGEDVVLSWVPFPKERYPVRGEFQVALLAAGRVLSIRDQFGFTFAGYPLEFMEESILGRTSAASPLEVELPRGSYLFVFRKEGFADARYPLAVPRAKGLHRVRLLEKGDVPEDMVHVPAGAVLHGVDPQALDSLANGESRVGGFLMGRHEVEMRGYLEFLREPLNPICVDRGDKHFGTALPASPEVKAYAKANLKSERILLIPRLDKDVPDPYLIDTKSQPWQLKPVVRHPGWPVFGVSQLAAREYAHWYTVKKGRGRRYRLPTDLEWQRAARGADRRAFVWGDYPAWSFAWCHPGIRKAKILPEAVGASPIDESVFGVRDMIGSVSEHTTGITDRRYRYTAFRGGNFHNTDAYHCRIDSRYGRFPENPGTNTGIRLVADLEERQD